MLDGRPLVDAHVHAARLSTLKPAWRQWAHDFGDASILERVYGALCPDEETAGLVLAGNATSVYNLAT
jgi:uncharacterized protein